MAIFACNHLFRIISDGEKIVFLRDGGGKRECIIYERPLLSNFNINIDRPMIEMDTFGSDHRSYVPGLIDYSVDLSLKGGEIRWVERPLVMGVDLFSRYSVTDYLDIINEKIRRRP